MLAGQGVGSPRKRPGERRKEKEPGRALRQEQTSSRRTHTHCGKSTSREDGREEEKRESAPNWELEEIRGGGPGRRGDRKVLLGSKPGRIGWGKGQGEWPKTWNKGPCAWDCLGPGVRGVSLSVPVCDLLSGLRG